MKNRLFTFIESKNITPTEFANKIGVSPAAISSIKTGRTQPTLPLVEKIKQHYPDVNISWLIFGEGDLKIENNTETIKEKEIIGELPTETISNSKASDYEAVYTAEQPKQITNKELSSNIEKTQLIRKAKKIVIFYTDGTFEEFDKSTL